MSAQASDFCFAKAAQRYQVNPLLLMSISKVESGFRPAARNMNRNGSVDTCHMQINSVHFAQLQKYGISERALVDYPCICTETGAWILAQCIQQFGNTWEAVGCYNAGAAAGRGALRSAYARKVYVAFQALLQQQGGGYGG